MSKGKNCEIMNPWYAAYAAVGSVVFIPSAPFLWLFSRLNRRFAKGWKQRLGFLPNGLSAIDAPFDVLFSVRKALSIAEPRLMVFLELSWNGWVGASW